MTPYPRRLIGLIETAALNGWSVRLTPLRYLFELQLSRSGVGLDLTWERHATGWRLTSCQMLQLAGTLTQPATRLLLRDVPLILRGDQ